MLGILYSIENIIYRFFNKLVVTKVACSENVFGKIKHEKNKKETTGGDLGIVRL